MVGRPSKLTEELQKEICGWIEKGNTFERASRLVDISESCFFKWKAKGINAKSGKYFHFLQSVKKAEDKFKAWNVSVVMKAAQENAWQAAAWLLERKYPEEFGRKDRFKIDLSEQENKLAEMLDGIRPE